ncbi:chromosome segregation protein SMC [Williamsia sp. CHRR-6]|uniref:chromosome segregation protein SMC n=1 Tax=Williamsia sp. CHRR-6 TaxID=2835871 RepID=UPI001BDB0E59|nr:chromosome segregation protein SMC [Williamsia sp. CHRR-6]MBT0568354.1 chromosome segregation protein SMC [Williamsia sp. CHRR-6]
MHLKSLTLKGFKSFASATTLKFEPGITCVVGPNGSGKSNVVDALTWVMGEQGAKALRGGKMEDVIFAGTSGRAPLGRAEVTLTIDNSDGALPIDYSEVSVTRRMFRDGAGEYEINGTSCRLMDVQELLSDSGIGREMHVIVGQGRLAAILESRPEDRRAFIEEAAGVLKHRKRKEKAVRKLDAMQANLARLTDLTDELRRQLKPLGRQAEVARRAQTVQADLRDARLRLAADDLVTLRASAADRAEIERELRAKADAVARQLEQATTAMNRYERAVAAIAPAAAAAGSSWFRLSALAERVDATRRVAAERARHLAEPVIVETGRDPDALEAQAAAAAEEEAALTAGVEVAFEELQIARETLAATESAAAAAESAHMAAVRAVADRREGLVRLEGQVTNLATRAESTDAEAARLTAAIADAAARAEAAQVEFDAVQATIADLDASEQGLDEHHERTVAALNAANARVAELQAAERAAEQRVASLTARIDALSMGLTRRDGGAWLLEHAQAGVGGVLSDQLRTDPGYEAAIAAALGPAVDALIASDEPSARAAIAALKSADAGRAALVISGVARPASDPQPLPPGARWAASVVSVAASLRGAIDLVLARVVIADDDAVAAAVVAAARDQGRRLDVVTLDGDVIGPGWISGGSGKGPSTIEVQADIDSATADLAASRRQAAELAAALAGATAEQEQRRESAEEALAALHESDATVGAVYEQLARLGQSVRAARDEQERLTAQRTVVESGRSQALAQLQEMEERLRAARAQPADTETDGGADAERVAAAAAVSTARAEETEARLALRTAEERLASVRGRADSLRRSAAAERQARARAEQQNRARAHAAAVAAAVVQGADQIAQRLHAAVATAQSTRDDLEERRVAQVAERDAARAAVTELGATLSRLREDLHRDELAGAQVTLRVEQLEEQIRDSLAIGLDELLAEYGPDVEMPPTELEMAEYHQARERGESVVAPTAMRFDRATQEARAKKAQKDLTTLGKVNPLALEEFAALEERYTFLSTQLEDVKSARRDLLDVVDDVDAKILQVFTEAYADVEREFAAVFTTLFPGGEGRLLLTDPGDMLTTGIEVEARPPGKKVKRLSLLSGGEKSLTAVAMLVAIFRARPSPFYVMDEVEAALDDTNLRRLIMLFEQLRERSQLIVITHQKPTMEIADALYGVSMQGDGITTVISQRLRGVDIGT